MHTVVETPPYLAAAKDAGLGEADRLEVVRAFAEVPDLGALMVGTGGYRKTRFGAGGKGKSGGVRVISFYAGEALPVFLITLFAKNEKDNLTKAERNALAKMAETLVSTYARKGKQR